MSRYMTSSQAILSGSSLLLAATSLIVAAHPQLHPAIWPKNWTLIEVGNIYKSRVFKKHL